MNESTTIAQLLDWASQQLGSVSDTPKLEARLLFRFNLQISDVELITTANKPVSEQQLNAYKQIILKRKQGTPVAYLTGVKEFWSLSLTVTPRHTDPKAGNRTTGRNGFTIFKGQGNGSGS